MGATGALARLALARRGAPATGLLRVAGPHDANAAPARLVEGVAEQRRERRERVSQLRRARRRGDGASAACSPPTSGAAAEATAAAVLEAIDREGGAEKRGA